MTDLKLSYSSAQLLANCETKYTHYKVHKTPKDPDAETDSKPFVVGRVFHKVLEYTLHAKLDTEYLLKCCTEAGLDDVERYRIAAMVLKYIDMYNVLNLACVKCEIEVVNEYMLGYIDAVFNDVYGNWYIVDLKTASRINSNLENKLASDEQLNLYTYCKDTVATLLNLDKDKFKGVLYCVVSKPSLKMSSKETPKEFVSRCKENIDACTFEVPFENLIPSETFERHKERYARALELHNGARPLKNLSYCESFFRPCEYYSQCHNSTFTDSKNKIIVRYNKTKGLMA